MLQQQSGFFSCQDVSHISHYKLFFLTFHRQNKLFWSKILNFSVVKNCMNVITKICLNEVLQPCRAQFFLLLAFSKKVGFAEEQNMNGYSCSATLCAMSHQVTSTLFPVQSAFSLLRKRRKIPLLFELDMFSREVKLC